MNWWVVLLSFGQINGIYRVFLIIDSDIIFLRK